MWSVSALDIHIGQLKPFYLFLRIKFCVEKKDNFSHVFSGKIKSVCVLLLSLCNCTRASHININPVT